MREAVTEAFNSDGVVHIPGVFTKVEADLLRAAALRCLAKSSPDRKYKLGGRIQYRKNNGHDFPAILFWPCLIDSYIDAIRTDVRMQEVVKGFLGGDVKQLNNQLYYRLPNDGDAFAWHQDIIFRKGAGEHVAEDYIQTNIAIDRMGEDNGGIAFLPGSHKNGDMNLADKSVIRQESAAPEGSKTYHLEPGDMLVWNLLTAHGSKPNTSDRTRMMLMNGFCRSRSSRDWPVYLKDGVVQEADSRAIPYE